jgi:KDO2-lipid IV(A) lauroyltransferase
MEKKKRFRKFQRALARYGLYSFFWLFKRVPYAIVRMIGFILIKIGFVFTIKQKAIARESLNIAFKNQLTKNEIEAIVRRCFNNFGWGMVEMLYALAHPEEVDAQVEVEGKHHLEEALKKGNGVIAVTAHFGNFPLMMLALAQKGYPVSAIIRPARDQDLENFLVAKRTQLGVKTVYAIPRPACVSQSLQALRENNIVFVALDQNFGNGSGVFVEFFGQKAATATGPVVFAMRSKAAILPMFIMSTGKGKHKIIIETPLAFEKGQDDDETIYLNTAKITRIIENYIRKYPYEWGWMHRRWKTQLRA